MVNKSFHRFLSIRRMRSWLPGLAALMLLWSCASAVKTAKTTDSQVLRLEKAASTPSDTIEYELIIFDPGFESWFLSNRKPEWYYSQDYLETWNYQYVVAWNIKVRDRIYQLTHPDNPFELEIDYSPHLDYGLDLNYRLYHYFRYIEASWGRILPYDRKI